MYNMYHISYHQKEGNFAPAQRICIQGCISKGSRLNDCSSKLSYVHEPLFPSPLQSTNILQQCRQFSPYSLQIRISSDVFFVDVDTGNGGLAIDFLQRSLNVGSIIYSIIFISPYPYLSKVDIYIPTWSSSIR